MRIEILIDQITSSVQDIASGKVLRTDVLPIITRNLNKLRISDWLFDWKRELDDHRKEVFQLVIAGRRHPVWGPISIEDRNDHIFIHLIESSKPNKGKNKIFIGIPGNLVAFACKVSFERGYSGFVSSESKTKLIEHYKKSLGAKIIYRNIMAIDTVAAVRLIDSYFPKKL